MDGGLGANLVFISFSLCDRVLISTLIRVEKDKLSRVA